MPASLFRERRREHSRKPEASYRIIETMYPDLPKIELFARQARPGWQPWGNEIETAPMGDIPEFLRRGAMPSKPPAKGFWGNHRHSANHWDQRERLVRALGVLTDAPIWGQHDLALNRNDRLRGGSQNASAPPRGPRRHKHFDRTTLRRARSNGTQLMLVQPAPPICRAGSSPGYGITRNQGIRSGR